MQNRLVIGTLLWVVKDEDTTIYLFGSIHVLKPGLSWFDGAVKQAFDASDSLMLEVVLPEDEMTSAKATIPDPGAAGPGGGTASELEVTDPALVAAAAAALRTTNA